MDQDRIKQEDIFEKAYWDATKSGQGQLEARRAGVDALLRAIARLNDRDRS